MTDIPEVPVWATRLLAARTARDWSQRDLARELIRVSDEPLTEVPNLIRRIRGHETGEHRPDAFYTRLYCKAFGLTEDQLFGTVIKPVPTLALPTLAPDADLYERITRAIEHPSRVDMATVQWLEHCLAEHRRVEDTIGSRPLLPLIHAQLSIVADLARGARGPLADRAVAVLAQYAQFIAWMCQDSRQHAAALAWYDRSHAWALEAGDACLASTTLNMRAHQAWSLGDAPRCVRLAEASRWHDGRTAHGVQGMAAQMAGRGHAQLGEANQARTRLAEAEDLIRTAAEHPDDEPPWMYFYDEGWFLMQRGMAELELGDGRRAADYLERGLSTLPYHYRRDRAWFGACLARAQALQGDAEAAVATALDIAPDATTLNAYAETELHRIAHDLAVAGAPGAEALRECLAGSKP
ncbi:helix-turn-helix transcriptional regulator [Nonomuraea sp. FMUSA5-5]|uniref:Helix-turn-helix transcriptional regulator n=1 Tax=Nonomuraea composti TaxID=2720023 RepID=A0ABX1BRZ1_9ACTN|nr:helix-turn-helix transcriptional regulator [Nonomuraea sp. FMUSA5-5]NJP98659.1 helix-turn-helix transcriptional regulator [Nonomuraea sp. FMUSA5-5]